MADHSSGSWIAEPLGGLLGGSGARSSENSSTTLLSPIGSRVRSIVLDLCVLTVVKRVELERMGRKNVNRLYEPLAGGRAQIGFGSCQLR